MQLLISGDYNAFNDGYNGAGVYMASGLFTSETFERPIYIGSSIDIKQRITEGHVPSLNREYFSKSSRTNAPLFYAWKKHGSASFVWCLLESCAKEETIEREQFYLDLYTPFCDELRGYNIAKEAGKPVGDKTEAHRANISKALTGKKKSPEHAAKCACHSRARNKDCFQRMADSLARPFTIIDPNGNQIVAKNLTAFCRQYGLNQGRTWLLLHGKAKSHKGWTAPLGNVETKVDRLQEGRK